MSKRSSLLCVVCVLVVALLAGNRQLHVAAAQIGDELLCQDPILMLSHACHDELNGVVNEEAFLSPGNEYAGEEALLFVDEERVPDLDRSADGKELVDEEEGEENSLLGGQGAVAEGSSEEHGSGGDIECPECGKHFRSDKSMFGHLRSHPDRGYKGATPPSVKPPKLMQPVDDSRPVARYSQRDPNLNAFEILAAYVMLTLKHRDSQIARDQSVKREPDLVPGEEDSVMSKAGDGVARVAEDSVKSKAEDSVMSKAEDSVKSSAAAMAGENMARRSEHGSSIAEMGGDDHQVHQGSSSVVQAPTKRVRTKKSKEGREARMKEKDVPSASKARRPYICKHCKAEFPTHQALGGHMAAHNKERKVQAQNEQATAAAWEEYLPRRGGSGRDGLPASTTELLLERYTRLFNQGRQPREETAVGYKRQHTEREGGGAISMAPPAGDRRRLFGVDLNVQAPERE